MPTTEMPELEDIDTYVPDVEDRIHLIPATSVVSISPWAYQVLLKYSGKEPGDFISSGDVNNFVNDHMMTLRFIGEALREVCKDVT